MPKFFNQLTSLKLSFYLKPNPQKEMVRFSRNPQKSSWTLARTDRRTNRHRNLPTAVFNTKDLRSSERHRIGKAESDSIQSKLRVGSDGFSSEYLGSKPFGSNSELVRKSVSIPPVSHVKSTKRSSIGSQRLSSYCCC